MVDLRWDGDDFRNEQDSSGSTADKISHSGKLQQGYQHGSLTKGLVAYYPMEKGEGEVLHDGALANLGQLNGATWNTESNFGSFSLEADDSNIGYAEIPNFSDWLEDGEGKIAYWVNISTLQNDGNGHPHVTYTANSGADKFQLENKNGNIRLWVRVDSNSQGSITLSASTNTWYFVVGRSSSGTYELFVDNVSQGTETTSSLKDHKDGKLGIGGNPSETRLADAKINDVRIYDRALSEPEIQALYNISKPSGVKMTENQVPGQEQGGISRYKLNGNPDDSWGSNDGAENGVTYKTGVYGQSATFDRSAGDYVSLPTFSTFNSYTASTWVKTNTVNGNYQYILSIWGDNDINIYKNNNDYWRIIQQDTNDNGTVIETNKTAVAEKWVHLVGTWDGSTLRFYKDGSIVGKGSISSMRSDFNRQDTIGARGDGSGGLERYFDGQIDDVRSYNTALTPQQVEKLYHKDAYRIPRESTLH